VDVARFKSEFLAGYWRRHGTAMSARALGHVHEIARWGSRFAPISNVIAQSGPARRLNEAVLGVDRRRAPPAWTARTFARRFRRRPVATSSAAVWLFNDTFTNYYSPDIGMAGQAVLERLGFAVNLAPNVCCGRPLISQGLLAEARQRAEANTTALHALAEAGDAVVFFEPSCLSAVREDAPALLSGEARRRAEAVAKRSFLFEELVEQECQRGTVRLDVRSGPARIVLHGHCHQKSMGALAPAKALLGRIPGATVVDLDAGCCGMAGSFGYMRDHFDVSRAIGERRLLPAARDLGADAVLVASGVSCRHQIADFTGVRALHAAELIRSLMTESA
jgi:Fe-S oxidoreductase